MGPKNPFLPKKSSVVKRDPDEVYPARKGMHTPEFLGDSPLDLLFQNLERILSEPLDSVTATTIAPKLLEPVDFDSMPSITLYRVAEKLLGYLLEIQSLSIAASASRDAQEKQLISVSLHDIKTFSKLFNVILKVVVYPVLGVFHVGVPLEKRRLNDFGSKLYKPLKVDVLPALSSEETGKFRQSLGEKAGMPKKTSSAGAFYCHQQILMLLYSKLYEFFSADSDVKSLLMKGSGYSDFLVVAILLATSPYFKGSIVQENGPIKKETGPFQQKKTLDLDPLSHVTCLANTYELFSDYSVLLSTPSPAYFKTYVMTQLQALPYTRKDGVLTLIEFILGLRENEEINIEKLDHVANVLLAKPKFISTVDYFSCISQQCYTLLININRPTICSCVGHFLEKLWMRNPKIVVDFFLRLIWDNFDPKPSDSPIWVSETALNNNINVMISLTNRGLPRDLLSSLMAPLLLPLWAYYCFLSRVSKSVEVTQNIIVSFLTQLEPKDAADFLDEICRNLTYESANGWEFRLGANQMVEISSGSDSVLDRNPEKIALRFIEALDTNIKAFMALISSHVDHDIVRKVFIRLFRRWFQTESSSMGEENPYMRLIDLRLVESIGSEFSDRLAESPVEILQLVNTMMEYCVQEKNPKQKNEDFKEDFKEEVDSDDEDDEEEPQNIFPVVLELLSAIISETQPAEMDAVCRKELIKIQKSLDSMSARSKEAAALSTRIGIILEGECSTDSALELQKRTLKAAIANLNDPLVPIRAHGLYTLRQLVEAQSPVISSDFVVGLHVIQLKDPEPYIYLNVIKGLESLLQFDDGVLPELISIYTGSERNQEKEKKETKEDDDGDINERLRVGEVLLRYVQAEDQAFSGEKAQQLCQAMLSIIRRPKDDSDKQDDRLRMSAMSILGTCCNTNVIGILPALKPALDCAIGILQLEPEKDQAIMRRSAIVLIHDLVVGTSKTDKVPFPKEYMSSVQSSLRYVQAHDNDMLVREQANQVLDYIDELVKVAMEQEG